MAARGLASALLPCHQRPVQAAPSMSSSSPNKQPPPRTATTSPPPSSSMPLSPVADLTCHLFSHPRCVQAPCCCPTAAASVSVRSSCHARCLHTSVVSGAHTQSVLSGTCSCSPSLATSEPMQPAPTTPWGACCRLHPPQLPGCVSAHPPPSAGRLHGLHHLQLEALHSPAQRHGALRLGSQGAGVASSHAVQQLVFPAQGGGVVSVQWVTKAFEAVMHAHSKEGPAAAAARTKACRPLVPLPPVTVCDSHNWRFEANPGVCESRRHSVWGLLTSICKFSYRMCVCTIVPLQVPTLMSTCPTTSLLTGVGACPSTSIKTRLTQPWWCCAARKQVSSSGKTCG